MTKRGKKTELVPAAARLLATARAGTVAARIIPLMNGRRTFEQIGAELGIGGDYARVRVREGAKRKGIGFAVDGAGRVRALLPRGVRVADVIVGSPA
jgi:hypothetical protein